MGVHVSGKGKWGHCSSKCPLSESEEPDELEEQISPCTLPNGSKGSCQPYGICGGFGLEDRDEEAAVSILILTRTVILTRSVHPCSDHHAGVTDLCQQSQLVYSFSSILQTDYDHFVQQSVIVSLFKISADGFILCFQGQGAQEPRSQAQD